MLNCQNAAAIRISLCVSICIWSTITPLAVCVEMWFLNPYACSLACIWTTSFHIQVSLRKKAVEQAVCAGCGQSLPSIEFLAALYRKL